MIGGATLAAAFPTKVDHVKIESDESCGGKDVGYAATLNSRRGRKDFTLDAVNSSTRPLTQRYAVELIDDRGKSMMVPIVSKDSNIASQAVRSEVIRPIRNIEDGYYIFRAKIVFVDSQGIEGNAIAETYLEILDGEQKTITRESFVKQSLYNVAIQSEGK